MPNYIAQYNTDGRPWKGYDYRIPFEAADDVEAYTRATGELQPLASIFCALIAIEAKDFGVFYWRRITENPSLFPSSIDQTQL